MKWFVRSVMPALRRLASRPLHFSIVGTDPGPGILALGTNQDVEVVGEVADLAEHYKRAELVVVPLRTGGGTRIKILEAASYQRAIVSTSKGADGLRVYNDDQILLAEGAEEFARACASVLDHQELRRRLGTRAFEWVSREHTLATLREVLVPVMTQPAAALGGVATSCAT